MIPIVLSFSRVLAAVATNLDRSQQQQQQQHQQSTAPGADTPGSRFSFVEDAANVLRDAFIKCLAGSPGVPRTSRPAPPDDKRLGIYLTANSCLKLLTQCGKLRNAQQMFSSIDAQSPPLAFYPAAQRVTYLYHLGRYHFANSHFIRAIAALQAAYEQCHAQALNHRRVILIYLISANICVGRFPSRAKLLSRPEAVDLAPYFVPLCTAIRTGDLGAFAQILNLKSQTGRWFLRHAVLLQLQDRCEILVWRSLIRQVFRHAGYLGAEERKVPFLRLYLVQQAAWWAMSRTVSNESLHHATHLDDLDDDHDYIDPELADLDAAILETGFDLTTGQYLDDDGQQPPSFSSLSTATTTTTTSSSRSWPSITEVESIVLSLIQQHLLRGFTTHTNPRFAIPGAQKLGGPMKAGFPGVWRVIAARMGVDPSFSTDAVIVPGWVEERTLGSAGGNGNGNVVRITGARPAGA